MSSNNQISIAIVGAGPRGIYSLISLLETLASEQQIHPSSVRILLIDPKIEGNGETYRSDTPLYFIMNTLSSQVTCFPENSPNPSLMEWLHGQGLQTDEAYVPRRWHGEYLEWAKDSAIQSSEIQVESISASIEDIQKLGEKLYLRLSDRIDPISVDYCLVTANGKSKQTEASPYTLVSSHTELAQYVNEKELCIRGLGLTAIDAIIHLCFLAGGHFTREGNRFQYTPSGKEPLLYCWSRSGELYLPRAKNQKSPHDVYKAKHLTFEKIEEIQSHYAGLKSRPDFETDYLPLLEADIAYAYKKHGGTEPNDVRWQNLISMDDYNIVSTRRDNSTPRSLTLQKATDRALEGNIDNPVNAALEVLRDLRDEIRACIEWGALSPKSHKWIVEKFTPQYLKLIVGPPWFRIAQMRALVDSGILIPLHMDELLLHENGIELRDGSKFFERDRSLIVSFENSNSTKLYNNLLKSGLAREFSNRLGDECYDLGGLEINRDGMLISDGNSPIENIWALGGLTEGVTWYTYAAARSYVPSRTQLDAEHWASQVKNAILIKKERKCFHYT